MNKKEKMLKKISRLNRALRVDWFVFINPDGEVLRGMKSTPERWCPSFIEEEEWTIAFSNNPIFAVQYCHLNIFCETFMDQLTKYKYKLHKLIAEPTTYKNTVEEITGSTYQGNIKI